MSIFPSSQAHKETLDGYVWCQWMYRNMGCGESWLTGVNQPVTCSKSAMETPEQWVISVQS